MRKIMMVQTFDGKNHENKTAAIRYLDKLYADTLFKIAHALIYINTESKVLDKTLSYIDENLDLFYQLMVIKKDMNMIEEEED